jgi:hypothetical protein
MTLLLILSQWSLGQSQDSNSIDPDLIDPEMTRVMYLIEPKDIKITSYRSGSPSAFKLKLCDVCRSKNYSLDKGAGLLLNGAPLALEDLTIQLIKKKFDVIQLGINRESNSVTYLYLGGTSESNTGEF